jgi:hypothetical protein
VAGRIGSRGSAYLGVPDPAADLGLVGGGQGLDTKTWRSGPSPPVGGGALAGGSAALRAGRPDGAGRAGEAAAPGTVERLLGQTRSSLPRWHRELIRRRGTYPRLATHRAGSGRDRAGTAAGPRPTDGPDGPRRTRQPVPVPDPGSGREVHHSLRPRTNRSRPTLPTFHGWNASTSPADLSMSTATRPDRCTLPKAASVTAARARLPNGSTGRPAIPSRP